MCMLPHAYVNMHGKQSNLCANEVRKEGNEQKRHDHE